jgi:hypothetical protein
MYQLMWMPVKVYMFQVFKQCNVFVLLVCSFFHESCHCWLILRMITVGLFGEFLRKVAREYLVNVRIHATDFFF